MALSTHEDTRKSTAVELALSAVVLMWASTFSLFKVAWREVDPVAFTAVRFASMVVLAVAILALSRRTVPLRRADVPAVVAAGLTGYFLYQMGFILGLDRTTAVASAILVATHPIWSVVFAWVLGRERPTAIQLVGVGVGFAGVAVFLRAWDAFATATPGDLLSLGAAAAFGAYGVISQPLARRYPSAQLMAYGLLVGGLLVALVGIPAVVHQDWSRVGWTSWLILVYATVGPVYLAYAIWNWAIKRRGIARTVVYGFVVPVVAAALAIIWLHEQLHPEQVVGTVLVLAGLVVARLAGRPRGAQAPAGSTPGGAGRPADARNSSV